MIPQHGRLWKELAGLDCPARLSLAAAGDLGPSGGDPDALDRRDRAFASLEGGGPDRRQVLICRQVHSLRVAVLLGGRPPRLIEGRFAEDGKLHADSRPLPEAGADPAGCLGRLEADGVITDWPGYFAAVTVADCLPILLSGRGRGAVIGALHSGWGGTGILALAVKALAEAGMTDLSVLLGPCIAGASYPVPPERAGLFARRFGPAAVSACADGQPGLDLVAANRAILEGHAHCLDPAEFPPLLAPVRLILANEDTFTTAALHSYRREGPQNYGRMLAMIGPVP